MTALCALAAARTAGVEVAVDGSDLVLGASAQPPRDILDHLTRHKAEIVALLRPDRIGWTVIDWRAFFDERAGIFEFEAGLTRAEAQLRAFACCIAEWCDRHAQFSSQGHDSVRPSVGAADLPLREQVPRTSSYPSQNGGRNG